ncbi:hypothetical protein F-liban_455 [Faustovirus]|nr:hypothetical protein F-liban_455 [Faustovirus]SME65144.1 Hypothetical protein FSTVST1_443 [Faustovirus ST1]
MNPIEARAKLVNGNFTLPDTTLVALRRIREACGELAQQLLEISRSVDLKVDTGRMIAAMDMVQQTKDTACVSVILPHAS